MVYDCSEYLNENDDQNSIIENNLNDIDIENNKSIAKRSNSQEPCGQNDEKECEPLKKKSRTEKYLFEKRTSSIDRTESIDDADDCVQKKPSTDFVKKDEYEETLTCSICTEIIHNCVR